MKSERHQDLAGVAEQRFEDQPAISLRDVRKVYGARRGESGIVALDRTNLDIGPREFVSLLGPSGCGKTTLLKIVGGLLPASAGDVLIQGGTVEEALRRRAFGFVFQNPTLLPWRKLEANARLLPEIVGRNAVKDDRIRELLDKVGLNGFGRNYPQELSGGMQQRAGIVRALALNPDILLMDEPFAAVDALTRDHLGEVLLDVWAEARPIVFVTHSIEEAIFLSDRVIVMTSRPGRVLDEIRIPLPRPRNHDVRDSRDFANLRHQVRAAVDRAQSSEGATP